MNAPIRIPEPEVVKDKEAREPVKRADLTDVTTVEFVEAAARLKINQKDAHELLQVALSSIELTPEKTLAFKGGREMLAAELERGIRMGPDGSIRLEPGSDFDRMIAQTVAVDYPPEVKRVEVVGSNGVAWYEDGAWHTDRKGAITMHSSAVEATDFIAHGEEADELYEFVRQLRDSRTSPTRM
ncbi:MAG: hypothetical protein ACO1Q7_02090 [Gemmatimonas sp.]